MSLEIVVGPMFSGKSTHALTYIRRQRAIGLHVVVIKPNIDNRYSQDSVLITHNKEQTPCITWNVEDKLSITEEIEKADCIVIEEAQFFRGLFQFTSDLLKVYKKNILLIGLDGDANQQLFGEIMFCMPLATWIMKLNAFCSHCRDRTLGPFTKKINVENQEQVDVGGADKYEAVCLKHLLE